MQRDSPAPWAASPFPWRRPTLPGRPLSSRHRRRGGRLRWRGVRPAWRQRRPGPPQLRPTHRSQSPSRSSSWRGSLPVVAPVGSGNFNTRREALQPLSPPKGCPRRSAKSRSPCSQHFCSPLNLHRTSDFKALVDNQMDKRGRRTAGGSAGHFINAGGSPIQRSPRSRFSGACPAQEGHPGPPAPMARGFAFVAPPLTLAAHWLGPRPGPAALSAISLAAVLARRSQCLTCVDSLAPSRRAASSVG